MRDERRLATRSSESRTKAQHCRLRKIRLDVIPTGGKYQSWMAGKEMLQLRT